MNIRHIYSLCTQLQQISSTKEKEKFLVDNRCDEFDEFLRWLLDPQIVTGIDKKKLFKDTGIESPNIYEPMASCINDLGELLIYLKENNTGRDIDVWYCQKYINNFCYMMGQSHDDWAEFLTDVFTKRLKLGVNLKTVNKAYGKGFIHVHSVRLGSSRDKLRLKSNEWFSLSQKMNGIRATFVDGKMISRQGKEMAGLEHIIKHLKAFNERHNCNMVFDGELIRANFDEIPDNENFRLTTSIVNSEDGDKSQLEYIMFDCLPLDEFYEGESKENYKIRRIMLENAVVNICFNTDDITPIYPVPIFYQGTDKNEIDNQLAIADAKGYEGLMLDKNTKYYCKRDTGLIKIKSFKHSDLRIVDCLEGDGKYKGVLGAFVVQFKDNTVNVGSGFTDQQREDYWADRNNLIGKICQVKYKEISKDKDTGLESLQFPVFETMRFDKEEISYES